MTDIQKHIQEIQAIRTKLLYIQENRPFKTLAVVSTEAGAGRTSVAVDLAKSIANTGRKVALLDGTLSSNSAIQQLFADTKLTNNLADYLQLDSTVTPTSVVTSTKTANLSIVANANDVANATDLLGSEKMAQLVDYLKTNFDMVVIDVPELVGKPDGMIMVNLADAVLLVAKLRHTLRSSIAQGMDMLREVNADVIGWIENK